MTEHPADAEGDAGDDASDRDVQTGPDHSGEDQNGDNQSGHDQSGYDQGDPVEGGDAEVDADAKDPVDESGPLEEMSLAPHSEGADGSPRTSPTD